MSYHVKINDSTLLRRRILESSKDIIHVLKGYHRVLDIRDEKRELAEKLQGVLTELDAEMAKLEKILPEKSLKEVEQYLPKKPTPPKKTTKKSKKAAKKTSKKKAAVVEKPVSELERLEGALSNIEQRLSQL
jgi:hypothetical protein